MRFFKPVLFVALALGGAFFAIPVLAQADDTDYPRINSVEAQFDGFQGVSDEFVFSNVQVREGMDYNPALVDKSIRTLYATGRFDFVEIGVENVGEDLVDVTFRLVSTYTIQQVKYNGNESFSDKRLASKSELELATALDEYRVSEGAEKIRDFYVEKGFSDVEVDYRIDRDPQTGYAIVEIDVDEKGKVKITKIRFEGNEAVKDGKLRKVLKTKKRNIFLSWLTGAGKFDEKKFKEDLEILRVFYRDRGYLDVEVDEDLVEIDFRSENKIWITINVKEGQQYYLGDLSVANNTIFTEDELLSPVRVETDDPFAPTEIDDAATAVREYYTSRGYLEARVRAERVPNMETRRIDVVFRVRESEKFYVESIKVEGNTKTKTRVIIRELALRPGDVFDLVRMETSQKRLENTQFFEDVRLNPEVTNIPGRQDLGVTVREGRTGNLSFGAGFGSVESAVAFFELSQGNFDLFAWRSGFQGDGQKFRLRVALGTESSQALIAFEEPWLFEQRLAFGVELFRTESDFNSSEYNELRTGFNIYLRRRLFELVEARLSYTLELVEIFDVDRGPGPEDENGATPGDGVADVFQAAEGEDLVSKFGLTFLRDSRDSLIFTRKGNRSSIETEYAGLGGDVDYWKLEGRTAHYIPTFDTLEQSVSFIGRAGNISPTGDSDEVPFYDRFYLGGPQDLRGFEFRDIGPRDPDDEDESVGGNTYGFFSVEYLFRVAEPLGLVVFYDWGFVNEDDYDFSASDYADNWGFGVRVLLFGSPVQLDLGIPITAPDEADDGTQFNFSFGTRF